MIQHILTLNYLQYDDMCSINMNQDYRSTVYRWSLSCVWQRQTWRAEVTLYSADVTHLNTTRTSHDHSIQHWGFLFDRLYITVHQQQSDSQAHFYIIIGQQISFVWFTCRAFIHLSLALSEIRSAKMKSVLNLVEEEVVRALMRRSGGFLRVWPVHILLECVIQREEEWKCVWNLLLQEAEQPLASSRGFYPKLFSGNP